MRVKDWKKFQHFKDRRPPWIKLYRDLLDDPQYHALDGDSAKTLTLLWLLASEYDGYLPDISVISFRLRMPEDKVKKQISKLNHWLVSDDINAISDVYQSDIPEGEIETEGEADKEAIFALPDWLPLEDWQGFIEMRKAIKKPMTDRAVQMIINKLSKMKGTPSAILQQSIINNWQDVFELRENKQFEKPKPKPQRAGVITR